MPTYYSYDFGTGLYLESRDARPDPMETELLRKKTGDPDAVVWLPPAPGETDIAPPTLAANQAVRWTGSAWEIVPDYRGQSWWSDHETQSEIDVVGDPADFDPPLYRDAPPPPPPTPYDVTEQRDTRSAAGFTFAGHTFQSDPKSLAKINGAAVLASIAINQGATANDLRWHGGEEDFMWSSSDDVDVPMDAQTMQAFGKAAALHVDKMHRAAKALKAMTPIPDDYDADKYWL